MNGFYPDELIEEVRINNDIVDVISEYVKLDKKGKDFFGLCPFHKEKTPSFSVVPAKQIFYCFGCGKGGNVIHFVMNAENLDFIESVKLLAEKARITLPEGKDEEEQEKARIRQEIIKINTEAARYFFNNLHSPQGEKGRAYLEARKLSEQVVRKFGLGYSPVEKDALFKHLTGKGFEIEYILKSGLVLAGKNNGYYDRFAGRMMFPIFDIRGNVIAFGGRVLDSSTPKYINSPETPVYSKSRNLYALNFAKNSGTKRIIIVEGYMDVISLHQRGIINTVASLGTALTDSQGRILKKYAEEIIISFDADTAGQAATMRGLDILNDVGCNVRVLIIPQGKDPDEYIKANGAESFNKLIENSISLVEYKIRVFEKNENLDTIEGKVKLLNKVADVLSKVDNNVEREMYIKKLAQQYDITQESIFAEILKRNKPRSNFRKAITITGTADRKTFGKTQTGISQGIEHEEMMLLALLCIDNSLFHFIKSQVALSDYSCDNAGQLAEIIYSRLENKKGIVTAELLNTVDFTLANVFLKIVETECKFDDNKKAAMDIIKKVKLHKLNKRQEEILSILSGKNGISEGDVEKLKIELNSIILDKKRV